eukprot:12416043-Alexandrium_andersonii.AAC.1
MVLRGIAGAAPAASLTLPVLDAANRLSLELVRQGDPLMRLRRVSLGRSSVTAWRRTTQRRA